jgi:uncharacterized protein (TIGR03435 family)
MMKTVYCWLPGVSLKKYLALALLSASFAAAQTKEFEVASVKPHKAGDDGRVSISITPGGHWRATNVPVIMLLNIAFDLRPGQLSGAPSWVTSERYDIDAKLGEGASASLKPGEDKPYLQALLASRFGLKYRNESKEMPVYALVVGKGGPKMKESNPEERSNIRMGRGNLSMTKIGMDMFVRELSRQVGKVVLNETGLTGEYKFELSFTPENGPPPPGAGGPGGPGGGPGGPEGPGPAPGGDAPTVFTAVQEQLGLKLDARKAPVQLFIIDKLEKPEEN